MGAFHKMGFSVPQLHYKNYCSTCNQILHDDKDFQILQIDKDLQLLSVQRPKMFLANPRWQIVAILKIEKL